MNRAELCDRIIPVLEEHLVVQAFCLVEAYRSIDRAVSAHVEVLHELVEEEPPQRLWAPAVSGKQCALHDFRKVDEGENGAVEVREIRPQDGRFLFCENLWDVDRHRGQSYDSVATTPWMADRDRRGAHLVARLYELETRVQPVCRRSRGDDLDPTTPSPTRMNSKSGDVRMANHS